MCATAQSLPSYLPNASLKQKYAFFQALVCLSGIDGNVDQNEIEFIKDLAKNNGLNDMDLLTDFAGTKEVIESAKIINNRHLALELIREMCNLAHVDNELSDNEVLLIGEVGQAMGIEIEKIEQISNWIIDHILLAEQGRIIFEEKQ